MANKYRKEMFPDPSGKCKPKVPRDSVSRQMAAIKNTEIKKCWGGRGHKGTWTLSVGLSLSATSVEISMEVLKRRGQNRPRTQLCLSVALTPKNPSPHTTVTRTPMFTAAPFTTAKPWNSQGVRRRMNG